MLKKTESNSHISFFVSNYFPHYLRCVLLDLELRNSLAVQWLGFHAFRARGQGLIPNERTKLGAKQNKQKQNKTKHQLIPPPWPSDVRIQRTWLSQFLAVGEKYEIKNPPVMLCFLEHHAFCVKKHRQKRYFVSAHRAYLISLTFWVITTAYFVFFNASFSLDSSRLRKLEAVSSKSRFCLAEFQAIFRNTFICCFLQHYKCMIQQINT